MSNREIRKLARIVADHTKQLSALNRPQLAHSAIEGGSIDSYDHAGNLRLRIGDQGDGTQTITVVDGPTPPAPSAPMVAVDGPVLTVSWDGHLADPNIELPADFARIHVHLAQTPDMSSAPVRASIEAKAGASTVTAVETAGTWWVALAVEAQSGRRSPLSAPVEAVVSLVNLDGALEAVRESADGKNRNYYNPVQPNPDEHEFAEGDLWFDTSEDEDGLTRYTPHRWDGQQWVSLEDERTQAIQDAQREFEQSTSQALSDVQQAASGAQSAADAAQETANTARSEASSKAQAAQQAAEAHAEAVAEAERLAAIAAASDDATAKAAAAEAAAIAAAALDAKKKADAAQQAAEAKAKAAQSAADAAMGRANAAHSAAGNAADAAQAALQAATHNSKNLWSTSNPSGTAPQGTIWFKIDPATKNVVGQWQQTGGSATAFGSNWEKRSLTDALFDNIDAGKIGTGYLDVAKLVKAGAIQADKLMVGGPLNLIPGYVSGSNRGLSRLAWDEDEKALRYDGKGTVYADESFHLPPGEYTVEADIKASVAGTRTYIGVRGGDDTSVQFRYGINNVRPGTEWQHYSAPLVINDGEQGTFSLRMLPDYMGDGTATTWWRDVSLRPKIGSTLIADGAVTTEKLAAGAITAESGVIGSLDLGKATVGELDGARIKFGSASGDILKADALDGKVITGAVVQTSHEHPKSLMDTAGFHVTDTEGMDQITLGQAGGDLLSIRDAEGTPMATVSNLGEISGSGLNIDADPVFNGLPLVGQSQEVLAPTSAVELSSWLDAFPRGLIAHGREDNQAGWEIRSGGGEMALLEVQADLKASRMYKITLSPLMVQNDSGGWIDVTVRYDWKGNRPHFGSRRMRKFSSTSFKERGVEQFGGSWMYSPGADEDTRFLLTVASNKRVKIHEVGDGISEMFIEDVGPFVDNVGVRRTDNNSVVAEKPTPPPPPPPPPPQKKNYTKKYWANGGRTFYTRGGWRNQNRDKCYQGSMPGMGGTQSIATFPPMTGDLSGATITAMTAYVYMEHFYYGSGGQVKLIGHNRLSSDITKMPDGWKLLKTSNRIGRNSGVQIPIPREYWNDFKTGRLKGIGLGDNSPSRSEYGYGPWKRMWIEVKYRK